MELDTRPVWATGESELNLGRIRYGWPVAVESTAGTCHFQQAAHISSTRKALAVLVAAPPTRARAVAHRSGPCLLSTGRTRDASRGAGLWALGAPSRGRWLLCCSAGRSWARTHWLLGAGWPPQRRPRPAGGRDVMNRGPAAASRTSAWRRAQRHWAPGVRHALPPSQSPRLGPAGICDKGSAKGWWDPGLPRPDSAQVPHSAACCLQLQAAVLLALLVYCSVSRSYIYNKTRFSPPRRSLSSSPSSLVPLNIFHTFSPKVCIDPLELINLLEPLLPPRVFLCAVSRYSASD